MRKYFSKSLAILFTLLATTFVVFLVIDQLPYDAVSQRVASQGVNREIVLNELRARLGLNLSYFERYSIWLTGLFRGDLGFSIITERPVTEIVGQPILRTLLLNATAFLVSLALAIPIGIFSATRKTRWADYFSMFLTAIAVAVPAYFIGLLLIFNVTPIFRGLPISGMHSVIYLLRGYESTLQEVLDIAKHMILPVISMSIVMVGTFVPYIRNAMLEVLSQDYMRTAKAKGVPQYKVLLKHALKNALLPLVSLVAMLLPGLIMSNIFVEAIFRWPGVGTLLIDSMYQAEVYIVSAIVLFYTLITVSGSHLADWINRRIDPRLKEGGLR